MDEQHRSEQPERDTQKPLAQPPVPESPVSSIQPETTTNPSAGDQGQTNRLSQRGMDWLKIVVNVTLGIIALSIYYCQLDEMRKSTGAATKAADAAEKSVEIAAKAIDRPWVTADKADLLEPPAIGKSLRVKLDVINTGKAPALNVGASGGVMTREEITLQDVPSAIVEGGEKSRGVLAPEGHFDAFLECDEPLSNSLQIEMLDQGRLAIFAKGVIEYSDTDGHQHKTQFCFRITGKNLGTTNHMMDACAVGNTAN